MAKTTYANAVTNIQSTIYGVISADSAVKALMAPPPYHIIDGSPYKLSRERGFPYIIVPSPTMSRNIRVLDNNTFEHDVSLTITIASIQESVVRSIADAVMNALKTNQATTRAANLYWFKVKSTSEKPVMLDNGDMTYQYDINIGYRFVG